MRLSNYKQQYSPLAKLNALVFLRRGDEILLAMKKRGFGAGKWNGPGGKAELGETAIEAAARETFEEVGVKVGHLEEVATLNFYFVPGNGNEAQKILGMVYVCRDWTGEPSESEEMAPQWFNIANIPYDQMWEDDRFWLPKILTGDYVTGEFLFDYADVMLDMKLS